MLTLCFPTWPARRRSRPICRYPTQPTAEMPPRIGFFFISAGAEHFSAVRKSWRCWMPPGPIANTPCGGVGRARRRGQEFAGQALAGECAAGRLRGRDRCTSGAFTARAPAMTGRRPMTTSLSAALAWFGVELTRPPPWDKGSAWPRLLPPRTLFGAGRRRAAVISTRPAGRRVEARWRAQGAAGVPGQCGSTGLCLVTSRAQLTDFGQYQRNASRPAGAVATPAGQWRA